MEQRCVSVEYQCITNRERAAPLGKVRGVGGSKSRGLFWSGETPVDGSGSSGVFRTAAAFGGICSLEAHYEVSERCGAMKTVIGGQSRLICCNLLVHS